MGNINYKFILKTAIKSNNKINFFTIYFILAI